MTFLVKEPTGNEDTYVLAFYPEYHVSRAQFNEITAGLDEQIERLGRIERLHQQIRRSKS